MIDERHLYTLIPEDVSLRVVEPHIYSVDSGETFANTYDKMSAFYDSVMGNRFYNRIIWGYWPKEYVSFCRDALSASTEGSVLDAACGSLVFTASVYAEYPIRPVILLDQSIEMLRSAKARLVRLKGEVPSNIVFVHADALQMPFKPRSFSTVLCLNLLHVLEDLTGILAGLKSIMADRGAMFLTTLVKNNRFGDKYLNVLSRTGMINPRTANQILAGFDELDMPVKHCIKGNLMFIQVR